MSTPFAPGQEISEEAVQAVYLSSVIECDFTLYSWLLENHPRFPTADLCEKMHALALAEHLALAESYILSKSSGRVKTDLTFHHFVNLTTQIGEEVPAARVEQYVNRIIKLNRTSIIHFTQRLLPLIKRLFQEELFDTLRRFLVSAILCNRLSTKSSVISVLQLCKEGENWMPLAQIMGEIGVLASVRGREALLSDQVPQFALSYLRQVAYFAMPPDADGQALRFAVDVIMDCISTGNILKIPVDFPEYRLAVLSQLIKTRFVVSDDEAPPSESSGDQEGSSTGSIDDDEPPPRSGTAARETTPDFRTFFTSILSGGDAEVIGEAYRMVMIFDAENMADIVHQELSLDILIRELGVVLALVNDDGCGNLLCSSCNIQDVTAILSKLSPIILLHIQSIDLPSLQFNRTMSPSVSRPLVNAFMIEIRRRGEIHALREYGDELLAHLIEGIRSNEPPARFRSQIEENLSLAGSATLREVLHHGLRFYTEVDVDFSFLISLHFKTYMEVVFTAALADRRKKPRKGGPSAGWMLSLYPQMTMKINGNQVHAGTRVYTATSAMLAQSLVKIENPVTKKCAKCSGSLSTQFFSDPGAKFNSYLCRTCSSDDTPVVNCTVCLDSSKDMVMKITACGHVFCEDCLRELSKEDSSPCPLCRQSLTSSITIDEAVDFFMVEWNTFFRGKVTTNLLAEE